MTAINVYRAPGAVHICTDGLAYSNGRPYLAPKVYVADHVPLMLATRGLREAKWLFGTMIHQAFAGFDELVDGIERAFPDMHAQYLQFVPDAKAPAALNTELVIAGWSPARQQCEAYFIRAGEDQGERSFPPWKLVELDGIVCGPVPSRHVDVDLKHFDRDMIALMEAQRREFPMIGGFCQMTSLSERAVYSRILRRWS